jgi:hypothetical protein
MLWARLKKLFNLEAASAVVWLLLALCALYKFFAGRIVLAMTLPSLVSSSRLYAALKFDWLCKPRDAISARRLLSPVLARYLQAISIDSAFRPNLFATTGVYASFGYTTSAMLLNNGDRKQDRG